MQLTIVTPIRSRSVAVHWFEVNTYQGNMIIRKDHAPLILTLQSHQPFIFCHETDNSEETIIPIAAIIDFNNNHATLLVHEE